LEYREVIENSIKQIISQCIEEVKESKSEEKNKEILRKYERVISELIDDLLDHETNGRRRWRLEPHDISEIVLDTEDLDMETLDKILQQLLDEISKWDF